MHHRLFLLLTCIFVVMIGFGVTLPVLPFYARHLHKTVGVSRETMAIHISLLTSLYALSQFLFAPFWGKLSDRVGRRPLILLGIGGSAVAQMLFGLANSLWLLYVVRALGGFLSSATLPAATSYIADITTDRDRSRGMALLGGAVSLGVIAGPALSGLTTREDIHFRTGFLDLKLENFAPPFFVSAALMFVVLLAAARWLPESIVARAQLPDASQGVWQNWSRQLTQLLGLTLAGQFGLSIFEATFALYAQEQLNYGPVETGFAFMVCGLVMALFQLLAVGYLTRYISVVMQIALGFGLMGLGIGLLLLMRTIPLVLGAVGLLSLGMALITPNLAALISKRGGQHTGALLGLQNAANSLGQVGGPLFGGTLFAWQASAPYLFAGTFLMGIGAAVSWNIKRKPNHSNRSHSTLK